jgi:uncharacterized repeat protein (TIGR01451 family)
VVKADPALFGPFPTTIQTLFLVSSDWHETDNGNSVVNVQTTYLPSTSDLSVTATGAPSSLPVGSNVTFTGTLGNAGPDAASNTHFNVNLNATLLFQSIIPPPGFTCTTPSAGVSGSIDCSNASFANGGSAAYTIVAQVSPTLLNTAGGTIDQLFVISADDGDSQQTNNTAHVVTAYTTPHADLAITNSDTPDPVVTGGTITYTQVLTNNGPDGAANVNVIESIGGGVTFQSLAVPAGFSCTTPAIGGTGTISCAAATMASGATATFSVVVNVTAAAGTVTNTVATSSDNYDPAFANNSATATTTIPSADLSITKTTGTGSAPAGGTVTYTIVVSNAGPTAASSVVMTDILPASLLFLSITTPAGFTCTPPAVGASGTITCNAATLASGGAATFTLVVQIAPNATGTIINTAGVSSATSDPNGGNGSGSAPAVTVGPPQADLSVTKTTTATTAVVGSTIPYVITVTNHGPSIATNVVATDDLPAGLQFVSAVPSQGTCTQSDPISCSLGTLAAGASATVTVQAKVTATSGSLANSASVSATESDPAPANGSSSAPALVVAPASAAEVPALGGWLLLALAMLLGVAALVRMR